VKYEKLARLSIGDHPELSERWVQERIAEDPSILGLGDVTVIDGDRIQETTGFRGILLQAAGGNRRFVVAIQLGKTDESHLIRAIEFWDSERKRSPEYEHTAVLVAEELAHRFLDLIGIISAAIPVQAIRMNAVQVGDAISLVFANEQPQSNSSVAPADAEAVVTMLRTTRVPESPAPTLPPGPLPEAPIVTPGPPHRKRTRLAFGAAAVALVVVGVLFYMAQRANRPPPELIPEQVASSAPVANPAPLVEPMRAESSPIGVGPQPAAAAPMAPGGTLHIAVKPWGEVHVDGKKSGVSPPLKRLSLAEGAHKIEISNPRFATYATEIQIQKGRQATVAHEFK
jgi:hypothetical protein